MSTTAYELSIGELCRRLDELASGVAEEFAQHQQRLQSLRETEDSATNPAEVRGAVLASALALLEAVDGLQTQVSEVRSIIDQQQQLLHSLHTESRTDALTGQLNRRAFEEELARRTAEAKRTELPLAVVLVDIDHFKLVNDSYGHAAGDKALKGVSNVLSNTLRDMDIVARIGGEEFALILPNTILINACRAAERARLAISRSVFCFDEHELAVTISAGVAIFEGGSEQTLARADDALYAAKQAGRNRTFAAKDGYCQPLHREPTGDHGAQRRRWMRFVTPGLQVKFRHGHGPWFVAEVKDESLTGVGLIVREELSIERGAAVELDYNDDVRVAEVMFIKYTPESGTRLGLRWRDAES